MIVQFTVYGASFEVNHRFVPETVEPEAVTLPRIGVDADRPDRVGDGDPSEEQRRVPQAVHRDVDRGRAARGTGHRARRGRGR